MSVARLRIADLRDGQLTQIKTALSNAGLTGDDLLALLRMGLVTDWVDRAKDLIATEESWGSARFFLPEAGWQQVTDGVEVRTDVGARFDPARVAIQVRSKILGGLVAPEDVSLATRWVPIAEGVEARAHATHEGIMVRVQQA